MRLSGGIGPLLRAIATRAGAAPIVEEIRTRPWASATFSGARHHIAIRFEGPRAAERVAAIADGIDHAEFDLGHHLLVDIAVAERRMEGYSARLVLEALVVEQD